MIDLDHPNSFEEGLPALNQELNKRRGKWKLSAIAYMDYEDFCQMVRLHVFKKWEQYDSMRPFRPWCNTIISSQLQNTLRNIYWNFERPCLQCIYNHGNDHCEITLSGMQCAECPLYAKWAATKKSAHDIKLAVSMNKHEQEVHSKFDDSYDLESDVNKLNIVLKRELLPIEWQVYSLCFIEYKEDEEVAKLITPEDKLSDNQKRKLVKSLKIVIIAKTKALLLEGLD